jgi:hypothetical protein
MERGNGRKVDLEILREPEGAGFKPRPERIDTLTAPNPTPSEGVKSAGPHQP